MNKIILRFTALAHAAKTVAAEDIQSNKLLSLSQVVEKWMIEELQSRNHQDLIQK